MLNSVVNSFRSQENQNLEFQIFKFHDVIKCLSIKKKYILLNKLGSKHSLLMKFGQFMLYSKSKNFIKKFTKTGRKTSSRPFCICKELSTTSDRRLNFWSNLIILVCNSKAIEISSNQHTDLLRFLFTKDYLKIKKDLELVSRPHFHRIA